MASLDIAVFLLIGGFGIRGFLSGFVSEILSLVAIVAGILAVRFFHASATALLAPHIGGESAAAFLAFVLLFGSMYVGGRMLAGTIGRQARKAGLGAVDRLLGLGFGAVKGLLIATIAFVGFTILYDALYGELSVRPSWMRLSRSYPLLNASAEAMSAWVAENSREGGLLGSLSADEAGDDATEANSATSR